jgi:hypothetical protein
MFKEPYLEVFFFFLFFLSGWGKDLREYRIRYPSKPLIINSPESGEFGGGVKGTGFTYI